MFTFEKNMPELEIPTLKKQQWTEEEVRLLTPYSCKRTWERILEGDYIFGRNVFIGPPGMREKVIAQLKVEGTEVARERFMNDTMADGKRFWRDEALSYPEPEIAASDEPDGADAILKISPKVVDVILRLANSEHVSSLSLPFQNSDLWRELIAIQVARSKSRNMSPRNAMPLIKSGGPIPGFLDDSHRMDLELGGSILVCHDDTIQPADVYVQMEGGGISAESACTAGNLSQAVFVLWYRERRNFCKFFLTRIKNAGEVAGCTREDLGDWVLYSSNDPNYIDGLRIKLPWNA